MDDAPVDAAWTLFGTLVYVGDWALHQIVGHIHWLEASAGMLGALALMLAGLYQFTPLMHL
jgi:predicted metal-binding membrane protein